MKSRVTKLLDALMGRGPLASLGRWWNRNRLVVLAYHGVDDRARFSKHLDLLKRKYNVVSLDDVVAAIDGAPLPKHAVLITFDDGERTVLTDGLPELQQRGLPSVLFAIADFIDSNKPFWWFETERLVNDGATSATLGEKPDAAAAVRDIKVLPDAERMQILEELRASSGAAVFQGQLTSDELRHLDESGMVVENHSWSHPLLDMCDDEKITHEVDAASARLEEIVGRPMRAFAYPNGNYDDRVVSAVRQSGTTAAFAFNHKIDPWRPSDLMVMSRVRVNSDTSLDRFSAIVSGVHPAIHTLRGGE